MYPTQVLPMGLADTTVPRFPYHSGCWYSNRLFQSLQPHPMNLSRNAPPGMLTTSTADFPMTHHSPRLWLRRLLCGVGPSPRVPAGPTDPALSLRLLSTSPSSSPSLPPPSSSSSSSPDSPSAVPSMMGPVRIPPGPPAAPPPSVRALLSSPIRLRGRLRVLWWPRWAELAPGGAPLLRPWGWAVTASSASTASSKHNQQICWLYRRHADAESGKVHLCVH
jgi:hypothetical protein